MPTESAPPVRVRGARCHNLSELNVDLPTGRLVVLRGVSGAGKTSLAMHTLVAEGRRRMVALLLGTQLPRPDVDAILDLPATVGVPAATPPGASRGRVGDATELGGLLRAWGRRWGAFRGRDGVLHRPAPVERLADQLLSRATPGRGRRTTVLAPVDPPAEATAWLDEIRRAGFVRLRVGGRLRRLDELDALPAGAAVELVVDRLRLLPERRDRLRESLATAAQAGQGRILIELEGEPELLAMGTVAWDPTTGEAWPAADDRRLDPETGGACPACGGSGCEQCEQSGLGPVLRALTVDGQSMATWVQLPLDQLRDRLVQRAEGGELQESLVALLAQHCELGLGHVQAIWPLSVLGSGERSRLRLLGASRAVVPGQLLIVDEPCARLGRAQRAAVVDWLRNQRERGVSVLVVDHAPDVGQAADWEVVFAADRSGTLAAQGSPAPRPPWPEPVSRPASGGHWTLRGAEPLPGRILDVSVPRGRWTTICGPSGSGKTRLLQGLLAPALGGELPASGRAAVEGPTVQVRQIERVASTRSPRSCVATHCKVWGYIRTLLARTREARVAGLEPQHFSFNRPEGRCPRCSGAGVEELEIAGLPPESRACPDCGGSRFLPHVARVRWRGHDLGGLLRMTAAEAAELFASVPRVAPALHGLVTVGLGHLPLGRPTRSLSTGETQRLHLARLLTEGRRAARDEELVLIADGVDVGLGDADSAVLVHALAALRDEGLTLITASYHPALAAAADQVITLEGP